MKKSLSGSSPRRGSPEIPFDQLEMLEVSGLNSHNVLPVAGSIATSADDGISAISLLPIITGLKYNPAPDVVSSTRHASCNWLTFDVSIEVRAENLLLDASCPNVAHPESFVDVLTRPHPTINKAAIKYLPALIIQHFNDFGVKFFCALRRTAHAYHSHFSIL